MEDMYTNASAGISRRTFISGSAMAGTLAALGLAGCAPKTGTEKEMPATGASTSDISWDEECEVLVVGSGYSGLAAAIEAKNAGADVKIIEKMKEFKGNCIVQTMFLKGGYQGKDMDNTSDKYVLPWIEAVKEIAPRQVMIYTIDRETPDHDLQKATHEELDRIVALLEKEGIPATASY